ncbi:AMP-dependent synthetase and ligase [Geobacter metallireducens RCH3]|uniref:Acyl-CoA synthetase, AMP-forming n=1 Tax=Geobacter metallireducens (strain ATCC 53774 / DSM 7210 / GS-15) TaxID=269799 RepID=Q39Z23_GEOMG|nr:MULTISPECIES: fatty acid--CoA ligase [Geobacter]ABB30501.1 acyl-CoA synthetase, AMP-forming [Geobacter metallireducens GS-15]EHP85942.1 AMP-dependent synthetase and ligase [Geobacter metallireducens RCH3]MBT1076810.1 fatty acid--CoA ligase [Geobacter grbiciae]
MSDPLIPRTPSAYDYPLLIKNLLFCPVVDNPDQEIVYRDLYRGTYRGLRERVRRLASVLTGLGVKPGDTVAVMDWDSHRYLELFFAVPMIGAVLHTINVRLSPEQILYTIDHAEDDLLLVNSEFLPILEQIRGRLDAVQGYVLLTDEAKAPETAIPFLGEYEALLAAAAPEFEFPDFDENTRATTFYTTGTTGMPKGVYFSHRQLVLHSFGVMTALSTAVGHGTFRRTDVYMPITPMFHVHAWGMPYVASMLGVKQVYPGRYVPDQLLELIEREKVTFSHCVPTILHMLLKHPHAERIDLSGWKVIIGGAAMSRTLCLEALRRGIDVFTGYGMSETCPILSLSHLTPEMLELSPEEQATIRCKTGQALPLVDLRVAGGELRELPRDGVSSGEIVVRAPWLTQGYLKDHKASERLWDGGYLHTGDVAVRDGLGYVRITDRTKDVIKVAGEWVSSLELEDIFAHHPAVAEVAVIGQPDEKWGERPLALVVAKPGEAGRVTEKELVHHVREYADKGVVSKQVVLARVRLVEAIDKTSVGKTNKVALREKYL